MKVGILSVFGICLLGVALMISRGAAQESFDKLSSEDRKAFGQRFEKEIFPLMSRGGKDGCVGCHSGKLVSSLKLTGDADKDFHMLLKEGFFLRDDAGSILERITDRDPKRRMPRGKGERWSDADVATLRAFVVDLDKKQKK